MNCRDVACNVSTFFVIFAANIEIMKRIILLLLALCVMTGMFAQDFDLPCGNLNYKPEVQTVLLYADDNQLNDPITQLHLHPLQPRLATH